MAELAIPTAGHGGSGASFINTLFIETTLGTNFAMQVSSSNTIADVKRRIIEEHQVCFPECGAIRVNGLKVKREGVFFHLAESMLVEGAFDRSNTSWWFIIVEASVVVCKGKEIVGIQNCEEKEKLALVNVKKNVFENEPSSSLDQNGSRGADDLAIEVVEAAQLRGGFHGEKVASVGVVVGSESRREEKSDGQAQDMEIQATNTKIDGSMLRVRDLDHQFDEQDRELEVRVMENRMDGSVLKGGDLNDDSNAKETHKKRKRIENASAEGPEVQVEHGEPAMDESKKDDLVSERSDKPSMETSDHEPVAKRLKTGKEEMVDEGRAMVPESTEMILEPSMVFTLPAVVDGKIKRKKKKKSKKFEKKTNAVDEISQKEARSGCGNVVSDLNDTTSELPTVSQLPVGDEQNLVNATVEGLDAEAKEKRKNKSSKKKDKQVNTVDEQQSMNKARGDDANVVSEPNDMTCEPPTVSQLPIGDEEQLVSATVGVSDAGAKKSSGKSDKEIDAGGGVSLKDAINDNVNVISESNDMNCDPPIVSQLPIEDDQRLVNATVEGSKAKANKKRKKKSKKEVNAVDEKSMNEAQGGNGNVAPEPDAATVGAPDADTKKKKKKKKSSNKMEKEVNADVDQSLKEAGGDGNGNMVSGPNHAPAILQKEADEHKLNDKDTAPVQEADHNNFPSQDVNDFKKPVPDEMHRVASEKPIATEVVKEVHSELPEAVPSLGLFALKKRKKSRKHKDLLSGTPVTSELGFVKDAAIDNSIHEAAEKGSDVPAKDGKEAVVAESLKVSLLVTDEEINEVIKNVIDSVPQAMETKAVAEVKERQSKKKLKKKHDSDAKISPQPQAEDENTGENTPVPLTDAVNTRTSNSLAKASKVGNDAEELSKNSGVNFMAYFSPTEQDKKTSEHSEITVTTKGENKRKVQDNVTPKLPEDPPILTGKRGFEANPHVGSSGKENKRNEVQQHSESFTNSTSKPKRSNKVQSLTQKKGNVKGGRRGSDANTGEVLNGTARKKLSSVIKTNLFGDGSDDTLETYVFPSQLSSTPEPDSDVSSDPDGESDAGFDGETRNASGGGEGMKTPFPPGVSLGTILKSSKRFKNAKLDAESQPDDFIPRPRKEETKKQTFSLAQLPTIIRHQRLKIPN